MIENIRTTIMILEAGECQNGIKEHGLFHSQHEGYAVIKEEIEEAAVEMDKINQKLIGLWDSVKRDEYPNVSILLIKKHAELLACEAIQIAAMAQKFIESFPEIDNE